MVGREIPRPVAMVVGDVLGSWYYNHNRLDTIFGECGAPGEPPEGSCVKKCQRWLMRCNDDALVDEVRVLGGVLEDFMTLEIPVPMGGNAHPSFTREEGIARIDEVLKRFGFSYKSGRLQGGDEAPALKTLADAIRERDLDSVEEEFRRAVERVESDPRDAATAACSLLEALFKSFIEDRGLEMPSKQEARALWKVVQKDLNLDPSSVEDEDVRRILSGLTSIVDGISALRTHAGSAHGRGRRGYVLQARHARLAVNASHTLALCVLETWTARTTPSP